MSNSEEPGMTIDEYADALISLGEMLKDDKATLPKLSAAAHKIGLRLMVSIEPMPDSQA